MRETCGRGLLGGATEPCEREPGHGGHCEPDGYVASLLDIVDALRERVDAQRAVVEAAREWAAAQEADDPALRRRDAAEAALFAAVEALPEVV